MIFNVYINGTNQSNELGSFTSLANVLHAMTVQNEGHASLCLEGCGVNNSDPRDMGAIFTFYLESQVNKVVEQINGIIQNSNDKLILNLYGFSRGGAAVFWMCKKLKNIDPSRLEINVASLEPVPGNFIRASYIDNLSGAGTTLSSQISDLSDCKNINNVLVLFTNIPLDDIACHGPVLPILPASAKTTVDVIPGCHANAQFYQRVLNGLDSDTPQSAISFHYIANFMRDCETQFDFKRFTLSTNLDLKNQQRLKAILSDQVKGIMRPEDRQRLEKYLPKGEGDVFESKRSMHFYNEIITKPDNAYLNLMHKKLETNQDDVDNSNCILTVKDPSPRPTWWNGQASVSSHLAPVLLFSTAGFAAVTGNPVSATSATLAGSYVYAQKPK
jgi:hypothetical protein